MVNSLFRLFYPGNEPWYPFKRKLGGPQIRSGPSVEIKIPCHCCDSNPGPPSP